MVYKDGAKMSKNKGNVVGADEMAERYGADTGRLFVLFAAPPEKDLEWQEAGVDGMFRFIGRVYRFTTRNIERARAGGERNEADLKALRKLHQTVKKVTEDFDSRWHFNTSIAAVMELMNELHPLEARLSGGALAEILEKTVLLLAPFVPYVTQELWEELGHQGPVFHEAWPEYDPELAREPEAEIPVQVNGKLRSRIYAPFGSSNDELQQRALADEKVQAFVAGKQMVRVIVVPDKLVNIVVKG
jgi:leucyl-tRNA synthetase